MLHSLLHYIEKSPDCFHAVHTLSRMLEESGYVRLPEGSWDDCAIYRGAASEAFEVAVIRLAAGTDSGAVYDGLTAYRLDRQGDFTGYDPEQAYLAERGLVAVSDGGGCAALLICEEPDAALTARYEARYQNFKKLYPALTELFAVTV